MSEENKAIHVFIERRWSFYLKRVTAFTACVLVLFGPGLLFDSAAMQWMGFLFFVGGSAIIAAAYLETNASIDGAIEHLQNLKKSLDPKAGEEDECDD